MNVVRNICWRSSFLKHWYFIKKVSEIEATATFVCMNSIVHDFQHYPTLYLSFAKMQQLGKQRANYEACTRVFPVLRYRSTVSLDLSSLSFACTVKINKIWKLQLGCRRNFVRACWMLKEIQLLYSDSNFIYSIIKLPFFCSLERCTRSCSAVFRKVKTSFAW